MEIGENMKRQDFLNNPNLLLREKESVENINHRAVTDLENFITEEEEKYHSQVRELVEDFISSKKKIILLCGPTSAGKTTTSKIIIERLKQLGYDSISISLDNFLVPLSERKVLRDGSIDYDSFATIDVDGFNSFIKDLFRYQKADMPIYNFVKNKPEDFKQPVEINENTVLIIEGLHALNPDLFTITENKNIGYKIYISPSVDFYLNNKLILDAKQLRLMRRSLRDYYKRGASIEQTFKTWKHTLESEDLYIKPFKTTVDYIINSAHKYEILLYAKYLKPLIMQEEDNKNTYALLKSLDACEPINKILVPDDSMLWEFLTR